jgi:hypothetical protein
MNLNQLKKISYTGALLLTALFVGTSSQNATLTLQGRSKGISGKALRIPLPIQEKSNTIKIALLLDTSGSMDGLIEQAKSQLWKIVNQLALAKKNGENANLQIALYEYGNDRNNAENGYVRQVLPLSSELDEISKELFALTTNGGSEHCGQVIAKSINELAWEAGSGGLQAIIIAGNEPFTQGSVNYKEACSLAKSNDILVNTIHCGDREEGIRTFWKDGADLTNGFYGTIDMNQATIYVETPYDDSIEVLSAKINETYLAYGDKRDYYLMNQSTQDANASGYGQSNSVERAVSKSSHVYSNEGWDLIDAKKSGDFDITKIKEEELPAEMRGMTTSQKLAYIAKKEAERNVIRTKIQDLNAKRSAYISQQGVDPGANSLEGALLKAIVKQAIAKNFTFDNQVAIVGDPKSDIDYDGFQALTEDVEAYRLQRLISIEDFNKFSKEPNTIILDARSSEAFAALHINGAININFADFSTPLLEKLIPNKNTRILIYCNNNFITASDFMRRKSMPLALNIPTFVNLYGYGYKNIYELRDLLDEFDPRVDFVRGSN